MKKTVRLLCALSLAVILSSSLPAQGETPRRRLKARVTKVYDGASFQLGGGLRSALIGVTAPAPGAPGSAQAHAYLKRLIENRTVSLEIDEKPVDAYGQTALLRFPGRRRPRERAPGAPGSGPRPRETPQRALPQGIDRSRKPRQAIQPGRVGKRIRPARPDRPLNFIRAGSVKKSNPS